MTANEHLQSRTRVQNEDKRNVIREVNDHQLTIDMAKELCMIQRSEIGKCCREYFLDIEKKWNSPEAVIARALLIANHQLQLVKGENTKLLEENSEQAEKIKSMLPKASYYDYVLNAEGLMPISTIAKDYGKSAVWLNKWLHEQGIQYKHLSCIRRLICCRELLLLGVGAANSTSIIGHKNNRQTMYTAS